MEKNSKKKKAEQQRKALTAVIAVLAAVLVLLIAALVYLNRDKTPGETVPGTTAGTTAGTPEGTTAGTEPEATSQVKELLVETVTERADFVVVTTTYCTVKYPYAFSDLIFVEAKTLEAHAELQFSAEIDGEKYRVYTLYFNGEEGMPLGTLQIDGESYGVTAMFHEVTGLDDDDMISIYAAQETFNDVVNSLPENQGFTAED